MWIQDRCIPPLNFFWGGGGVISFKCSQHLMFTICILFSALASKTYSICGGAPEQSTEHRNTAEFDPPTFRFWNSWIRHCRVHVILISKFWLLAFKQRIYTSLLEKFGLYPKKPWNLLLKIYLYELVCTKNLPFDMVSKKNWYLRVTVLIIHI